MSRGSRCEQVAQPTFGVLVGAGTGAALSGSQRVPAVSMHGASGS